MSFPIRIANWSILKCLTSTVKRRSQRRRAVLETLEQRVLLTQIFSDDFSAQGAFRLNGSANLTDGKLELTDDFQQRGSLWFDQLLRSERFTATFDFELTQPQGLGWADGFTFAVLNSAINDNNALGSPGGGLGYSGLSGFAIEFDTYYNFELDSLGVHVGLYVNGNMVSVATSTGLPFDIRDAGPVRAVSPWTMA